MIKIANCGILKYGKVKLQFLLNTESIFFRKICPTMQFRQWQKHKSSSQQKEAGRKETNLPQKMKAREKAKKKQKRRYMKSSCRWTTIHFHFEVLRAVVKCDCMWQLPSLPVYHDGYTLPTWWFCKHVHTHVRTQIHGYRGTKKCAGMCTQTQKPHVRAKYCTHT